jgi:L-fuconolactonase
MMIVDAHCHVSPHWFEPVESLLFQMDRNGVGCAVLVEDWLHTSHEYHRDCLARFPGRFAWVAAMEVAPPDAPETLMRLAEMGACGVRLRQSTRSPGDDPLAVWRTAARLGLSVSCSGRNACYASTKFLDLVQALPDLPIVIEHLGSGNFPEAEPLPPDARRNIFDLARFPNVYLKIHGLGEFCPRAVPATQPFPFAQPIPPLLDLACEAFGTERMMWGSDYPPVSAREGYANALRFTLEQLAARSRRDKELIFGGTARRLYRFRE